MRHAVSSSIFGAASLIMFEWRENGSVYKIKLFDPLRWPRSPASVFVSSSSITNRAGGRLKNPAENECLDVALFVLDRSKTRGLIAIPLAR